MAAGIPPPPLNSPTGSYYWLEWYTNLTNFLNGTNIPWSNINFTGSNITDIQTRYHNSLTNIQGGNASGTYPPTGNAYHLIGANFIGSVGSTGTAIQLPSGWTSALSGTTYTITHSLNLVPSSYVVMAVPISGTGYVENVICSANSFTVTVAAADGIAFLLSQGS
jgi:hypothetical protein